MEASIDDPQSYLLLHGWTRPDGTDLWLHPAEKRGSRYGTIDAVDIQRLNDRHAVLCAEKWEPLTFSWARDGDPYLRTFTRVNSPRHFMEARDRRAIQPKNAMPLQAMVGWSATFATPPKVRAVRSAYDIYVWCIYCDRWHDHALFDQCPGLGESAGVIKHPAQPIPHPYDGGYEPIIQLVTDEAPLNVKKMRDGIGARERTVLRALHALDPKRVGMTTRAILDALYVEKIRDLRFDAVREAIEHMTSTRYGRVPLAQSVSKAFQRFRGRVFEGRWLLPRMDVANTIRWQVFDYDFLPR